MKHNKDDIIETMDTVLAESAHEFLSRIGSKGGMKTASKGSDYYREIQKKSVEARHKNAKKKLDE